MAHTLFLLFNILLVSLCILNIVEAANYTVSTSDQLWSKINTLQPGDELIIKGGSYTSKYSGSFYREVTATGTLTKPIRVYGAPGEKVIIDGDTGGSQNIINFKVQYFEMKNIEFRYGSRGLRFLSASNVVFQDLIVHETRDVGIAMNDNGQTYNNITFRRNEVYNTHGTGECFYLGCNSATCALTNSLIENNICHDTQQGDQGDGIEIKTGSYNNIVRNNVIYNTKYPAITLYSNYYGSTYNANSFPVNIVEGNIIWNVGSDNGIQVTGCAIIRNNVVLSAAASGIAIQQNQGTVENVKVYHNTVVTAASACLRVTTAGKGIVLANNALYCGSSNALYLAQTSSDMIIMGNVGLGNTNINAATYPQGFTKSTGTLATDFQQATTLPYNLYPTANSGVRKVANATYVTTYDFNNNNRADQAKLLGGYDVGAYQTVSGKTTNPGWTPTKGFKVVPSVDGNSDPTNPRSGSASNNPVGGKSNSGFKLFDGSSVLLFIVISLIVSFVMY
ncbi:hypothetical protein ABK040_005183 [Willaertia magna]